MPAEAGIHGGGGAGHEAKTGFPRSRLDWLATLSASNGRE